MKLDFTNKVKKILNQHGDKKISSLRIARRPLNKKIEQAFNIISLGKWEKLRNKYYYDTLFHLSLQITLDDNTILSYEKFDVVDLHLDKRCSQKNVQCIDINYNSDSLTLNEFVLDPLNEINKDDFFIYDPFKANCQIFIYQVLNYFNLLTSKNKKFIYQDVSQIIKRLPFYVKWTAKTITNLSKKYKDLTGASICKCKKCISGGCDKCNDCPKKKIEHYIIDMFNDIN